MEPKKFWSLSFYEWTLWAGRIKHLIKERDDDRKLLIELERNSMALLANIHSSKKYRPQDFWTLPTDTTAKTSGMTDEEIMKAVKERFKKYIKHA